MLTRISVSLIGAAITFLTGVSSAHAFVEIGEFLGEDAEQQQQDDQNDPGADFPIPDLMPETNNDPGTDFPVPFLIPDSSDIPTHTVTPINHPTGSPRGMGNRTVERYQVNNPIDPANTIPVPILAAPSNENTDNRIPPTLGSAKPHGSAPEVPLPPVGMPIQIVFIITAIFTSSAFCLRKVLFT
ncbi:hypothetical protein HOD71_01540 [Candidatus Peribacteria bacterium]|nr:hypothetical protein [Candidatus Peribacteria bacterium]